MLSLLQLELPLFGLLRDGKRTPPAPALEEKRSIALNGKLIDYSVRRSTKRRTLGLTIDTRGLRVAAPMKAKQVDIERRSGLACCGETGQVFFVGARRTSDVIAEPGVASRHRVDIGCREGDVV